MNLPAGDVASWWLLAAGAGYLGVLGLACARAPWARLRAEPGRQHRMGLVAVGIMLCWWMRATVSPGLGFHFLGMTAATLILGWPLALLAGTAAVVGAAAVGQEHWIALGVTGLLSSALPVAVTAGLQRALHACLAANPFVDLLGGAFFGGVLAAALNRAAIAGFFVLANVEVAGDLIDQTLIIMVLTALPEGVVNGIVVGVLFAWQPDWVEGVRPPPQ